MNDILRPYFLELTKEFDLLVTGGSDLHGWFSNFEGFGAQPVTASMVDALRARHLSYNRQRQ